MLRLLADRARSECARSMRAVGSTCTHSAVIEVGKEERPPTKAAFLLSAQWIYAHLRSRNNGVLSEIMCMTTGVSSDFV